jgi:hypothetical protein
MYTGSLAAISNRADWVETLVIPEKPAIDEVQFVVRDCGPDISATLVNGKATYDATTGTLVFSFTQGETNDLCPGTYPVGCVITVGGIRTQLLACTIEVIDGVVSWP